MKSTPNSYLVSLNNDGNTHVYLSAHVSPTKIDSSDMVRNKYIKNNKRLFLDHVTSIIQKLKILQLKLFVDFRT